MCERDVRLLLTDKMRLDDAEVDYIISIERAHRLGRRRQQQGQPRPVVVNFSRYKHRQVLWNNTSKLKGTNYRVAEHFSDRVRERRRILIPRMEQERDRKYSLVQFSSVQFIYFTYSQNIRINLLLQSTAPVTKYNKELQMTIIIHFDCKRDKIRIVHERPPPLIMS